jgi:hypothetical protein
MPKKVSKPRPATVEKMLTDTRVSMRLRGARRDDVPLTPEQVERGLTDQASAVVPNRERT